MRPMQDSELETTLRRLPFAAADPRGCDDGLLAAWLAGRLDEAGSEAVEAHLAECRPCRDLVLELRRGAPGEAAMARALALLPSRRRWPLFAAALTAAAAVLALVLLRPAAAPDYTIEGPFGGVQAHRDAPGVAATFLPYSQVRLELAPAGESAPLSVYVSRPGGVLRAAPPDVIEAGPGGAYRVRFRADALLGPEPGPWVIHLVLGAAGADRDGETAPETPPRGAAWHRVAVEYQNAQ